MHLPVSFRILCEKFHICILFFLGRDLIGVQNLIKKHQAMLAEINNHENRVRSVCQSGEEMVQEGNFNGKKKVFLTLLNEHNFYY